MGYVRHALVLFGPENVLEAGLDAYRPLAAKLVHTAGQVLGPIGAVTRLILRCCNDVAWRSLLPGSIGSYASHPAAVSGGRDAGGGVGRPRPSG
ncbi:hypothetical protein OHT20_31555 [Streptomyces caniferus]|uniref:hypothetical protein n=1 Tax=Streptomyces caniferus TaxID=285557 RepID=UPI002E2D72E0|nr:hypothetical protein [Streptomyces caniferus]